MADLTGEQAYNRQKEDLQKDLDSRVNSNDLPEANIMVAGITGTGKSTLLNAVFGADMAKTGSGKPVTKQIDEYHNDDIPIRIWDTVGLELDSKKTKEAINAIKATIASKAESSNPYDKVHAIWYCINSGSNRYQGAELEFIKELHSIDVPFIIVLTQCSGDEDEVNAFESEIRKIDVEIGLGDIPIVQVLALPVKYRGMPEPIEAFGLEELVNVTLELLPSFIKSGFAAAQRVSQGKKREECEKIICSYVRASQNGFWDKVPLAKVSVTKDKIMKMFQKLGKMYNTVIPETVVEGVLKKSKVDSKNKFWGLISPIDMGYSKKITALLEQKKKDGFTVEVAEAEKNDRAARMIAFYGYTFVDSIEELWRKSTAVQLKEIDFVMANLIDIINQKLNDRNRKAENGRM